MTAIKKGKRTAAVRREKAAARRSKRAVTAKDRGFPGKCPACGKPVEEGWKACPACGANIDPGYVRQA
jgi:rRNA maturation endonuclease Nob1